MDKRRPAPHNTLDRVWKGFSMRIGHLALGTVIVLILAACEQKQEAAPAKPAPAKPAAEAPAATPAVPTGFQHDPAFDASGYFMTQTIVRSGTYQLRHIAVGAPSDFAQWEAGSREVFGPIAFQFEDMASPLKANELGAEVHTISARVLPDSYRFSAGEVSFRGHDPKVGEVIFSGAFNTTALAAAKQSGSSDYQPVLTGSLSVNGERIGNLSFNYWVGD